jgi:hypothetical protein
MDDLRDRMNRLAQRADTAVAPDLEQVRERHARRRRTSALTLGVALTAIVALLAFQVSRGGGEPAPSQPAAPGGDAEILTVWPSAETGDEPWRSSPEEVIQRFAYMVLGWSTPQIVAVDGAYEMRPEVCPDAARCVAPLTLTTVEAAPGLWSVQSVTHPELAIEVGLADPAVALTAGSMVRFDLSLADDRAGHIGMVASNGCREATAFEIGLDSGIHRLELPAYTADDQDCDDMGTGYLFAYAMDDTTVPTGDPLREAAAIEYPWLTVIPIYLEMEEPDASATATSEPPYLPETLTVGCGSVGTEVPVSVVAAGPMGVALEFVDEIDGQTLRVDRHVIVSERHVVLDLAPGIHEVSCEIGNEVTSTPVSFEVVDIEGYWTDPSVDCAPPASVDETHVTGPTSWEDMLIWAVEPSSQPEGFPEVRARFVGYPESDPERIIGMFHDPGDQLIRRLNVVRVGSESWDVEFVTCPTP